MEQLTLFADEKHYLPFEDLERYYGRHRHNIIRGYHKKMANKHRWYVQLNEGPSYYTDIYPLDLEKRNPCTFYDCGWTTDEWDTRPHHYNYIPERPLTEVFRSKRSDPWAGGYNADDVGYRRDGVWIAKYYHEYTMSAWMLYYQNSWSTYYQGQLTRYDGEKIYQGVFSDCIEIKRPVSDLVEPMIKRMAHKSNRDFYREDIKWICEKLSIRLYNYL